MYKIFLIQETSNLNKISYRFSDLLFFYNYDFIF